MDTQAIEYLEGRGYVLGRDWYWTLPNPGHEPTEREVDAIIYLVEEWDYGGYNTGPGKET